VTRTIVSLPTSFARGVNANGFAVSPDGHRLAYVGLEASGTRIYLQELDQFEAKPIPGSEGMSGAFFSPDSEWLGFSGRGKLMKVAVSGGAPQTICESEAPLGATWGQNNQIIFAPSFRTGLFACDVSGGPPHAITTPNRGHREKSHRLPEFLPGGRAVLFNIIPSDISSYNDARIAVLSLDTGKITTLLDGGTSPRFSQSGHLVYVRSGSLIAVPFDPVRLEIRGQSRSVADSIEFDATNGVSDVSLSENGLLAYVRSVRPRSTRVVWVDRNGRSEPLMDAERPFVNVRLAPDRQRLALTVAGPNDQVWVYQLARRTMTPLTFDWDNWADSWTPDGKRIVFRSDRSGDWNFYWQNVDGGGPIGRLVESANIQGSGSWSSDGRVFAFHQRPSTSGLQSIWFLTGAFDKPTVRQLTHASFSEQEPTFSPDGHWLAYVSTETGREEIFVRPFPRLDAKWQISSDGGVRPVWAPNGRELYYQNGRALMAVMIQTQAGFVPGTPRRLFEGDFVNNAWQDYDVAPDGRFIMLQTAGDVRPPQLALVHNWSEELKR